MSNIYTAAPDISVKKISRDFLKKNSECYKVLAQAEDAYDLEVYEKAMGRFSQDPENYTFDHAEKILEQD